MSDQKEDLRIDCLAYLNAQLEGTHNEFVHTALSSAIAEANAYDRAAPLLTLRRTVEACNAIERGEATELARALRLHEQKFRTGRSALNSQTVAAYVHLRHAADARKGILNSEWTGPRAETLRRPGPAHTYLTAAQDAQIAKMRPRPTSRQKRLEEIIAKLPATEDQQELRFEVQQRALAERKLTLLSKAIQTRIPMISIEELSRDRPEGQLKLSERSHERQRKILAGLRNKLQDNEHLRHFDLVTDGKRLKRLSTGGHFLSKEEFETLLEALNHAITA